MGAGKSDRISLTWPSGAVAKEWLQVTVLADANTGLLTPDVFYFGSAIGDSGNSATDVFVNGACQGKNWFTPGTSDSEAPDSARFRIRGLAVARTQREPMPIASCGVLP
jgi:hypothetical protein